MNITELGLLIAKQANETAIAIGGLRDALEFLGKAIDAMQEENAKLRKRVNILEKEVDEGWVEITKMGDNHQIQTNLSGEFRHRPLITAFLNDNLIDISLHGFCWRAGLPPTGKS